MQSLQAFKEMYDQWATSAYVACIFFFFLD